MARIRHQLSKCLATYGGCHSWLWRKGRQVECLQLLSAGPSYIAAAIASAHEDRRTLRAAPEQHRQTALRAGRCPRLQSRSRCQSRYKPYVYGVPGEAAHDRTQPALRPCLQKGVQPRAADHVTS